MSAVNENFVVAFGRIYVYINDVIRIACLTINILTGNLFRTCRVMCKPRVLSKYQWASGSARSYVVCRYVVPGQGCTEALPKLHAWRPVYFDDHGGQIRRKHHVYPEKLVAVVAVQRAKLFSKVGFESRPMMHTRRQV